MSRDGIAWVPALGSGMVAFHRVLELRVGIVYDGGLCGTETIVAVRESGHYNRWRGFSNCEICGAWRVRVALRRGILQLSGFQLWHCFWEAQ